MVNKLLKRYTGFNVIVKINSADFLVRLFPLRTKELFTVDIKQNN